MEISLMLHAVLLQAATVVNATASQPATSVTFTQLVMTVSIVVGLCTIGAVLYRMGGHAQDLRNTKDNIGQQMKALTEKVDEGFAAVARRFDKAEGYEDANDERRSEWSRWRERIEGRVTSTEDDVERHEKGLSDVRGKTQEALTKQGLLEEQLKPIAEVIKLRKRPLGDEL